MEVIKVADLTINADKLLAEMQQTKKSIEQIQKKQKELRDSGQSTTQQYIKQEVKLKTLNAEYRTQTKTMQQVTGVTDELNKKITTEAKSLGEAAAQNKELRQARENLNLTTEEGQKALTQINKKLDENTDFMKDNQDAQIQQKMGIGGYADGILEAMGLTGLYTKGLKSMTTMQKASNVVVGKSTGALKLFKIALASTGIGLLVIALGSLITYLTSTQAGIDKVNRVLTPLKEIIGTLKGEVQELGEAFFKLLRGDFKGFMADIKEIGSTIKNDLGEAITRGNEIAKIRENLNKSEAEYIKSQGELKREFEEQKLLSEDTTKTIQEREAAATRALQTQMELRKGTEERLKQEAELLRLQQEAGDTSDKERAELQEKLSEIDAAYAEEASKSTELQNRINSIRQEGYTKEKEMRDKALEDRLNQMDQELAYFEESQKLKLKTEEDNLKHLKEVANREEEILKTKLSNNLISEKEYQTSKLALQNEISAQEKKVQEEELTRIKEFEDRKKALQDAIRLKRIEEDNEREVAALEVQKEKELAELENLEMHETKKHALKMLLEEQFALERSALEDKHEKERLEKEKERALEEIAIRENLANAKLGISQNLTNLMGALAGENADIQKAVLLFEKGVAASQVIMQTQIANAKAVASFPLTAGMPWVGINTANMAISLGTIAAQAVSGMQQINKSDNKKVRGRKFARGGVLKGPSHQAGGIKTPFGELEGGEAVINKRSTSRYGGLLSAINMSEGGNPIMTGNQGPNNLIDYDLLASKLAQAYNSLPSPIVSVEEINRTSSRQVEIVERARF